MEFYLENRVFLQRNGKLLLFNEYGLYNGDNTNIDDYVARAQLRYIAIENVNGEIKQTNCYFTNTTDQYLTQHGEWIYIEDARNLPANELIHLILDDYYQEGRYNSKTLSIVKSAEGISVSVIRE